MGGKIYVIAGDMGTDYSSVSKSVEAFDPATNKWTPVADLGTARSKGASQHCNFKYDETRGQRHHLYLSANYI